MLFHRICDFLYCERQFDYDILLTKLTDIIKLGKMSDYKTPFSTP